MREQYFYGHGKLLLTGEYLVLDGAKSIAMPTTLGQGMTVKYRPSNDPKLFWKSYDTKGKCWFEATYEFWRFNCLDNDTEEAKVLKSILVQARKQNVHFLRDDVDVYVETRLEFPLTWGLGSSSTLVYNIAQWAYISPFELLSKTFGGSGYDIACAQSMGPITFEVKSSGPRWETVDFNPVFKDNIYFLYLNKKRNTREAIKSYKEVKSDNILDVKKQINEISNQVMESIDLKEFENLLFEHENLLSSVLKEKRIQDLYFNDYWGCVKSLGAWGGDFALITSDKSFEETQNYFNKRGYETIIKFDDLIAQAPRYKDISNDSIEHGVHGSVQ